MAQGYNIVEAKTFISSQQCLLWTVEHREGWSYIIKHPRVYINSIHHIVIKTKIPQIKRHTTVLCHTKKKES